MTYLHPSLYPVEERRRIILELRKQGLSAKQIGGQMGGVTKEAMYYHYKLLGIKT